MPLPTAITRVGKKELSAMQTLTRTAGMHSSASQSRSYRIKSSLSGYARPTRHGEEKPPTEEDVFFGNIGRKLTEEEVTS
jgi:hypothetical protein